MIDTMCSTEDNQSELKQQSPPAMLLQKDDEEEENKEMTFDQIKSEIRSLWEPVIQKMFVEHVQTKQEVQDEVVHEQYACDGCEVKPIKGVRYMCSVCGDYDLCQNCEKSGVHNHHTMLKIRHPRQAPHKLVCQYGNGLVKAAAAAMNNMDLLGQISSLNLGNLMPKEPKRNHENDRFTARFVKESFSDKFEVLSGSTFTKSWTFRNTGEVAWPDDVLFCQTSGDEMQSSVDYVRCRVQPGNEWTFTVNFKAPELPGKYTSFFRM